MNKRLTIVFLSILLLGWVPGCKSIPDPEKPNTEMSRKDALRTLEAMDVPYSEKTFLLLMTGAQTERNGKIAVAFFQTGINVNTKDRWGTTALMYAAGAGNDPIVSMLLSRGADVHTTNDDGETALHFAARSKSNSIPFLLLEEGADINATDICGITPLDNAERFGNLRLAMGLEQRGAKRGKGFSQATPKELTTELIGEFLRTNDKCEAQRALRSMRQLGGPERHYQVGIRYLKGEGGFPNNSTEAVKWLESAGEAGHPQARETLLSIRQGNQSTK